MYKILTFFYTSLILYHGVVSDIIANDNNDRDFITPKNVMEWWQTGVIYQVYPRSFKDSNGDGVGDLRGIEEKAQHFKNLGISAVWLSPIFTSPMIDFGYDISDFTNIAQVFGTMQDFRLLKSKLRTLGWLDFIRMPSLNTSKIYFYCEIIALRGRLELVSLSWDNKSCQGIKLVIDFVPNHSSDEHEWFQKSVKRIDPYTNYYVWRDPKGWNESTPIVPNNWISQFSIPAWTYNKERKQFYYHGFASKQPELNFRCKELVDEMMKILVFWMDEGVDGFRFDSISYLVEKEDFPDEPPNKKFIHQPGADKNVLVYDSLDHIYTMDQPETYNMVKLFKKTIHDYSKIDGKIRFMVTEAYTSLNNTLKYYDGSDGPGMIMPFNFLFIRQLNAQSQAIDFVNMIDSWMKNMPKGKWPNWVVGNHDNSRVASRYGKDLVDGINMIALLLPGTAFTYNGEEIGMLDGDIRWDQTVDPQGRNVGPDLYQRYSRDGERTPFQWDSTVSAGFSRNHKPWLPVNPNYWWLNLENQKSTPNSHYYVYKRLVKLRSRPTIQRGSYTAEALSNWTLVISRKMKHYESYLIVINLGTEETVVDLENIDGVPMDMTVHTSSVNSEHKIGDVLGVFRMRPKSAVVLTTDNDQVPEGDTPQPAKVCSSASFTTTDRFIFAAVFISFAILGCMYPFCFYL